MEQPFAAAEHHGYSPSLSSSTRSWTSSAYMGVPLPYVRVCLPGCCLSFSTSAGTYRLAQRRSTAPACLPVPRSSILLRRLAGIAAEAENWATTQTAPVSHSANQHSKHRSPWQSRSDPCRARPGHLPLTRRRQHLGPTRPRPAACSIVYYAVPQLDMASGSCLDAPV